MALEDMPLEGDAGLGTSSTFLKIRNEIRALDRGLLRTLGGVEIWQWLALAAIVLGSIPLGWLIAHLLIRVVLRWRREPDALFSIKSRFIWPVQLLLIMGIGLAALRILGLPEHVDVPVRIAIGIVLTLAGGWLLYNLIDKVGMLFSDTSGRFQYRYEMLRSISVAVAKVGVVIGAILVLAEVLGLPYEGVVAGLGIGGIAVALAAQSTIANFIGGLTLLADKLVQIGDFCRFGDQLGTVEGLGLRSVKIRSLDRTLYTIPNAEFINLCATASSSRRSFSSATRPPPTSYAGYSPE
jgi:small-conductance mechanosensitive channel